MRENGYLRDIELKEARVLLYDIKYDIKFDVKPDIKHEKKHDSKRDIKLDNKYDIKHDVKYSQDYHDERKQSAKFTSSSKKKSSLWEVERIIQKRSNKEPLYLIK